MGSSNLGYASTFYRNQLNTYHLFNNEVQEIEFNSPMKLIDELITLIEDNRRIINEIKGR